MFNVVIEKENYSDTNALVIREDINSIIQSIEEQLYNINISYRNNIRKIKNSLKSLEGISESSLVILENENVNDENLISYLTNVLEISLDCIISTLYENKEYRPLLRNVNNINTLLNIDSPNTKIFKNILEQCEDLFNVYAQINEIQISSTSFYELLDKSIENSVNAQSKYIPEDVKTEVDIYNKVIENLDNLVTNDLASTYDNIKLFAASQVKQVNEVGIFSTIGSFIWTRIENSALWVFSAPKRFFITLGLSISGISLLTNYVSNWLSGNKPIDANLLSKTFGDTPRFDLIMKAFTKPSNLTGEEAKALFELTFKDEAKTALFKQFLSQNIDKLQNALKFNVDKYSNDIATAQEAKKNLDSLIAELQSKVNDFTAKNAGIDSLEKIRDEIVAKESQSKELAATISELKTSHHFLTGKIETLTTEFNSKKEQLDDALDLIEKSGYYAGGIVIGAGILYLIYMVIISYIVKKKTFGTTESAETVKTILKLRKQIDELKKKTTVSYPDLKIQFNYLESEVKKCEREGTIKNDFMIIYNCGMKYFMGNYAIIMYSALLQLSKDGISLHKFNKLSDVHNYNGFASMQTRGIIRSLNDFYTKILDYDATLVDAFEKIFTIVKQQVLENKLTDNIVKQLPNRLTTTMAG